jgi:hypothetical protein
MANLTWLQAQVDRDEWDKLNKQRLALKLKWADILLPAAKAYLATLVIVSPPEPANVASDKPQAPKHSSK